MSIANLIKIKNFLSEYSTTSYNDCDNRLSIMVLVQNSKEFKKEFSKFLDSVDIVEKEYPGLLHEFNKDNPNIILKLNSVSSILSNYSSNDIDDMWLSKDPETMDKLNLLKSKCREYNELLMELNIKFKSYIDKYSLLKGKDLKEKILKEIEDKNSGYKETEDKKPENKQSGYKLNINFSNISVLIIVFIIILIIVDIVVDLIVLLKKNKKRTFLNY
jgi:hypothetical protein